MAHRRWKMSWHAQMRWHEHEPIESLRDAMTRAVKLPTHAARRRETGYAVGDKVLVVRDHTVVTVMTRAQWEREHLNFTWDGIPVRPRNERWPRGMDGVVE